MNFKDDFPMLNQNIIYFDNAATTFKPRSVIQKEIDYLTKYTSNAHRGEYNLSYKVDEEINETREIVRKFINAKNKEEIIFTSGATEGLNIIVNGFFSNILKENDEVIISKSEHASNVLPWLFLKKKKRIKIKYIPLNNDGSLNIKKLNGLITSNTKVISLAHITNVIGDKRDLKYISNIAKLNNIYTVVDAAQSIGHTKVDVRKLDIDFLVFSAHKMYGPTGVGVLYGKMNLLTKITPIILGGGMNEEFNDKKIILKKLPDRLEAGTQNISGIIAFKEAIKYIEYLDVKAIEIHEKNLRKYLVNELNKIEYINIYNKDIDGTIVIFDVINKSTSGTALFLNSKNICVRAGQHCVRMLEEEKNFSDSIRISLSFYNTIEQIDYLIYVLKQKEELYNF